jgi:hypothetical protein
VRALPYFSFPTLFLRSLALSLSRARALSQSKPASSHRHSGGRRRGTLPEPAVSRVLEPSRAVLTLFLQTSAGLALPQDGSIIMASLIEYHGTREGDCDGSIIMASSIDRRGTSRTPQTVPSSIMDKQVSSGTRRTIRFQPIGYPGHRGFLHERLEGRVERRGGWPRRAGECLLSARAHARWRYALLLAARA